MLECAVCPIVATTWTLILFEYTLITIHNFTNESPDDKSVKLDLISSWESFVRTRLCYLPENL